MKQVVKEHYEKLLQGIEAERKEEELYYKTVIQTRSIQERLNAGLLWWPVQLNKRNFTVGDYVELEFERTKQLGASHKIKHGQGVRIFKETGKQEYYAVVSYVRRDKMRVVTKDERIMYDNDLQYGQWGIEMVYDERPYRIMQEGVEAFLKPANPQVANLAQALAVPEMMSEILDYHVALQDHPSLNPSQINAINQVSQAAQIGLIHGPPGTGKTTTIVELICQLLKYEKKILVCTPSNTAVDLIARLLDKRQVNVLRVGNVSRIDDRLGHLTLEEKMRKHSDWQHIKKVRIEAAEARKMAGQYKRSFGEAERKQRSAMYREAKELRKWGRDLEDRLMELILNEAQVVCTTLIGAAHDTIRSMRFQTLIIDEASQALEPACFPAMLMSNRTILAGDHKQLPPVVKSDAARKLNFDQTILDRLSGHIHFDCMLNVQYRMHEHILQFSNKSFYKGKLLSHNSVRNRTLRDDQQAVCFIDTSGCGFEEVYDTQSRSYHNPQEFLLLREYILTQKEKQLPYSIGMISPYSRQVKHIRHTIVDDEELAGMNIEVDTIDGFQGEEKDIIYISLVRSNDMGNIGFLADPRRLNVAMTRAKMKLVLIGDLSTLVSDPLFKSLADFIESIDAYKSAWEYMAY